MTQNELQQLYDAVEQYGGYRPAAREIGMPESTLRSKLKGYVPGVPEHGFVPGVDMLTAPHVGEAGVDTVDFWAEQVAKPGTRRYILTSAQNNTEVHEGFLQNLEALAAGFHAQILVSFCMYDRQGYRGVLREKGDAPQRRVWWDKKIEPYAFNSRGRLHRRLAFCGELDVLATASRPLSGMESYCGRSSVIVPHNRFAFECVPSRKQHMPKEMFTTGSVTTRKFIQRKAGQIAHFHHVLGALLVEVTDDGYWFVHHLNADEDGSFYWLDHFVKGGEVRVNHEGVDAMVLGDIHHEKLDDEVDDATLYNEGGPHTVLQPEVVFVHDLIDFKSRNHHERDNPLFRVACNYVHVEDEIAEAGTWLDRLCRITDGEVVVVRSNHDDAYLKWIKDTDWRDDPVNAKFYLETALALVQWPTINPLQWAVQCRNGQATDARFLDIDESYEVWDIECGMHGHIGPKGSRGNPRAFSRLGFKSFTAHTHAPSIVDGCYTVGVMGKLDMDYNVGPSNWMHAHGIIYPNGKRAFVFMKNGRWRATD